MKGASSAFSEYLLYYERRERDNESMKRASFKLN
jgi:hypothetical protein